MKTVPAADLVLGRLGTDQMDGAQSRVRCLQLRGLQRDFEGHLDDDLG